MKRSETLLDERRDTFGIVPSSNGIVLSCKRHVLTACLRMAIGISAKERVVLSRRLGRLWVSLPLAPFVNTVDTLVIGRMGRITLLLA